MKTPGNSVVFFSAMIFLSILIVQNAQSEKDFPRLTGKYFGQKEPGDKAELFAPDLISLEGRYEAALSFSPKGHELLFSTQVPNKPARVYYTKQQAGKWAKPKPVYLSQGAKKEEMEAFFSWDGKYIYFAPYNEGMDDVRIWSIKIHKNGWRNPKQIKGPVSDDPAFFPTCSLNGVLYYTNLAKHKIFRAYFKGESIVKAEDSGIEFGIHPFIAPDESFVLLDALQEEGHGKRDIYVAFKQLDGSWTTPINLGGKVNTKYSETCPSLSSDGKFLFFSRYNEPDEISNIYWISSQIIEDIRKELKK